MGQSDQAVLNHPVWKNKETQGICRGEKLPKNKGKIGKEKKIKKLEVEAE